MRDGAVAPPCQAERCSCGSPVVGWGSNGDWCEQCWEDANDFARDERADQQREMEEEPWR